MKNPKITRKEVKDRKMPHSKSKKKDKNNKRNVKKGKNSDCMTYGIHLERSEYICLYDNESVCGSEGRANGKSFPRINVHTDVSLSDFDNRNNNESKTRKRPLGEKGKHANNKMKIIGCGRPNEAASVDFHSKEGLQISRELLPSTSTAHDTNESLDYSCNLERKDPNVYDVLPWSKCFENLTAGTIVPPSLHNKYALIFQRTFDAGIFLQEAKGMPLFVFKEDCLSSEGEIPLAIFIQLASKDFMKIKSKNKSSNVVTGTSFTESKTSDSQQQNFGQINFSLGSPACCSTPKHNHLGESILTPPYSQNSCYRSHYKSDLDIGEFSQAERLSKFGRCISCVGSKNISLMHDERVAKIQMDRKKYQASVVNTFPEVVDCVFQPVVIVEKIKKSEMQGLNLYRGFDDYFDDDKSKNPDAGKKTCRQKSSKDAHQSACTAQLVNVQHCSLLSGKLQKDTEFSSETSCNEHTDVTQDQNDVSVMCCCNSDQIRRVFDFKQIKTKLEMIFDGEKKEWLNEILLSGSVERTSARSDPHNACQVSEESRTPSSEYLNYITFNVPKPIISENTKPSNGKAVSQSFSGTPNHHVIGEDNPAPTMKRTLMSDRGNTSSRKTKLCTFQPVKKNRSRKKKDTDGCIKLEQTSLDVTKKDGFTIRLWQNYNKDVFDALRRECTICKKVFSNEKSLFKHTKKKHSELKNKEGGPPVTELYFCQPCSALLNSKLSLEKHTSTLKHLTISRLCEKSCISAWDILDIAVKPNEGIMKKLELVEILEEELADEVDREETMKDQTGSSLSETLNKTTRQIKTYIYNTPLLAQLNKIVEMKRKLKKVNSGLRVEEFLHQFEENTSPWYPPWSTASEAGEPLESTQEDILSPKTSVTVQENRHSSNDLLECTSNEDVSSLNKGTAVKLGTNDINVVSSDAEWIEEVVTAPDSRFHQLRGYKGSYFKKKSKKYTGKVIVCKRLYRTYQNKKKQTLGNCVSDENSLKSFCPEYNHQAPHSPYYPHPLIDNPKELYDMGLTQQDFPKQAALNVKYLNMHVPHELYEKHKYQRYKDLDIPEEFYHFDIDENENFITTTENIGKRIEGPNNASGNEGFVLEEESRDSYTNLLNSTSTMSAELKYILKINSNVGNYDTVCPVFTCELRPDTDSGAGTSAIPLQPNSGLNTPASSPLHKGSINCISSLIVTSASGGYDQDFEELWNTGDVDQRVMEDKRQYDVLNNNLAIV